MNKKLKLHILETLPSLRNNLAKQLQVINKELERPEFAVTDDNKEFMIHQIMSAFKTKYDNELIGSGTVSKKELTAGAKLHGIFRDNFFNPNSILFQSYEEKRNEPDERKKLLEQINFAHQNFRGIRSTPHSEEVFEDIVKDQIE